MRRIHSEKDEKKRRRNQIILGVFLVLTMFGSVIGFAIPFGSQDGNVGTGNENSNVPQSNGVFYNGFEFIPQNGFWILNFQGVNLIFSNNPTQVSKINVSVNSLSSYEEKPLYIYSENVLAESEIKNNLFNFVEKIEEACLREENCNGNIQIKTCEDNFIIIRESEKNQITLKDNCIFVEGVSEDLVRLTDELLFNILGIR